MDGVEISYNVKLLIVSLDQFTKAASFESNQKLFDYIEKLLPRNESVLKMKVQNAVHRGSYYNSYDHWIIRVAVSNTTTELVEIDQSLSTFDQRPHNLCVNFLNLF